MIKRDLAFFCKQALKTGLEVANDVADGDTFRNSARRRVPEGIKRFVSSANFSNQSGSGRIGRKRKRVVKKIKNKKKAKKSRHSDIFS